MYLKINILLLFFLMVEIVHAQNNPAESIERLFNETFESNEPGASLAVLYNGQLIFSKGRGLKELNQKTILDPYSNYRIGSVSKQFTAMAVMMLKEKGLIGYEDKIRKYFPDLPEETKAITIRHLLNHTSGMVEYDTLCEDVPYQLDDYEIYDLVKECHEVYFPAGTKFEYSNTGYVLLGLLVEKVSKQNFSEFLQKNIFKPLQMSNTMMYDARKEIPGRAWGHVWDEKQKKYREEDQSSTSALRGDGAIYTSVVDYLKWEKALGTGQLVSPKTWKEAITPPSKIKYPKHPYGFGWYVVNTAEGKVMYHKGETMGFRSFVRRNPDKKYAIVVFSNRDDVDLENFTYQISRMLLK